MHPCKCSLVAHEECLLDWIKAAEANPDKSMASVLKCPQCGSKYGLDSKNPLILRLMDNVNEAITIGAHGATVLALGSVVASIGAGELYLSMTASFTDTRRCIHPSYKLRGFRNATVRW